MTSTKNNLANDVGRKAFRHLYNLLEDEHKICIIG